MFEKIKTMVCATFNWKIFHGISDKELVYIIKSIKLNCQIDIGDYTKILYSFIGWFIVDVEHKKDIFVRLFEYFIDNDDIYNKITQYFDTEIKKKNWRLAYEPGKADIPLVIKLIINPFIVRESAYLQKRKRKDAIHILESPTKKVTE